MELVFMIEFLLGHLKPGVDYIGRLICVCVCAPQSITLTYLSRLKSFSPSFPPPPPQEQYEAALQIYDSEVGLTLHQNFNSISA